MTGDRRAIEEAMREILARALGISRERVSRFTATTGLFGSLSELDSMAVAGLLTEMEDRLDIVIDDDEVDAEMLESFGNLVDFAERKSRR